MIYRVMRTLENYWKTNNIENQLRPINGYFLLDMTF